MDIRIMQLDCNRKMSKLPDSRALVMSRKVMQMIIRLPRSSPFNQLPFRSVRYRHKLNMKLRRICVPKMQFGSLQILKMWVIWKLLYNYRNILSFWSTGCPLVNLSVWENTNRCFLQPKRLLHTCNFIYSVKNCEACDVLITRNQFIINSSDIVSAPKRQKM